MASDVTSTAISNPVTAMKVKVIRLIQLQFLTRSTDLSPLASNANEKLLQRLRLT